MSARLRYQPFCREQGLRVRGVVDGVRIAILEGEESDFTDFEMRTSNLQQVARSVASTVNDVQVDTLFYAGDLTAADVGVIAQFVLPAAQGDTPGLY